MSRGIDSGDLGQSPLIKGGVGAEIYLHLTPLSQVNQINRGILFLYSIL